jgi:hypothetical protein
MVANEAKDAVAADLAAAVPKFSMGISTVAAEATLVAVAATMVAAAVVAGAAATMVAVAATAAAAADQLPTAAMAHPPVPSSASRTGNIATLMAVTWMTTTPVQRVPPRANTISVLPPVQIPWGATRGICTRPYSRVQLGTNHQCPNHCPIPSILHQPSAPPLGPSDRVSP